MKTAERARAITKKQIALLHVAKRDLALADEDWRAILSQWGDVESSADLTQEGCELVLHRLKELGFRPKRPKGHLGHRRDMASPAQVALVRKLWRQYHGDDENDAHLNAWLYRFHHVSALRFVDAKKVGDVITALKAMTSR